MAPDFAISRDSRKLFAIVAVEDEKLPAHEEASALSSSSGTR